MVYMAQVDTQACENTMTKNMDEIFLFMTLTSRDISKNSDG